MAVKIAGNGPYAAAMCYGPQQGLVDIGKFITAIFYDGNGSTTVVPKIAHADVTDYNYGTPHTMPYGAAVNRGYNFGLSNMFFRTYGASYGATPLNAGAFYKSNDSLDTSGGMGSAVYRNSGTGITAHPNPVQDFSDTLLIAGHNGTNLLLKQSAVPYGVPSFLTHILVALGGSAGFAQAIPLALDSTSALYTLGVTDGATTIYERVLSGTTLGNQSAVVTDCNGYTKFRAVRMFSGRVFLLYEDTSGNLMYRIRATDGTWSAAVEFAIDFVGASAAWPVTSMAASLSDDVHVAYWDGTHIQRRVFTGSDSQISAAVAMVNAPSLLEYRLTAPYSAPERFSIMYHITGGNFCTEHVNITASRKGTDGDLISLYGDPSQGTQPAMGEQVGNYGGKSLIGFTGYCHSGFLGLRNSGGTWDANPQRVSKRYWDLHNTLTTFVSPSTGTAIAAFGGRDNDGTNEPVVMYQSVYAIDHASFHNAGVIDLTDATRWTNISPSTLSGRGYKLPVLDQADIPHLLFMTDISNLTIREWRGGAWSAPTTIITLADSGNQLYWLQAKLGTEPSGQKSIHLAFSFRDLDVQPEIFLGSIAQNEINYLKIVPQGNGTYKWYRADGTEFVGACSETNRDAVYDDPATAWWRVSGSMLVLADNTPCVLAYKSDVASPYNITALTRIKWSGSAWTETALRSGTGFPWHPGLSTVRAGNGDVYVFASDMVAGVEQLIAYKSTDGGETWTQNQITSSAYGNNTPLLSSFSDTEQSVLWQHQVSQDASEILLDVVTIQELLRRLKLIGSERFGSPIIR